MLNSTLRFILLNNFLWEEYTEQRMRNLLYFVCLILMRHNKQIRNRSSQETE